MEKFQAGQEITSNLPAEKGLPQFKEFTALHKLGSAHIISEWLLSNVLLLLLIICNEIELFLNMLNMCTFSACDVLPYAQPSEGCCLR